MIFGGRALVQPQSVLFLPTRIPPGVPRYELISIRPHPAHRPNCTWDPTISIRNSPRCRGTSNGAESSDQQLSETRSRPVQHGLLNASRCSGRLNSSVTRCPSRPDGILFTMGNPTDGEFATSRARLGRPAVEQSLPGWVRFSSSTIGETRLNSLLLSLAAVHRESHWGGASLHIQRCRKNRSNSTVRVHYRPRGSVHDSLAFQTSLVTTGIAVSGAYAREIDLASPNRRCVTFATTAPCTATSPRIAGRTSLQAVDFALQRSWILPRRPAARAGDFINLFNWRTTAVEYSNCAVSTVIGMDFGVHGEASSADAYLQADARPGV